MKKCIIALGVLMISFFVSGCGSGEDSSAPLFTVGGVVSGLNGTLVLQNNGADDLSVTENGLFTFSTATAPGRPYAVTVRTNPTTQTCIVSNGTGTILISSVTNVLVDCFKRGGLDVTFNSPKGFAVHNNAAGGNGHDFGNAVAIDSQGRILSAGSSTNTAGNMDMVVWRYNADGTLDTTFNSPKGFVAQNGVAGGNAEDYANGIAIDSLQGRILVTGSSKTATVNTSMVIWGFKDDGALDTTFNNSGIVSAAVGTADQSGNAIAIDSQHRILVTGSSKTSAGNTDIVVWRFNANGTIDNSFSGDGVVTHNSSTGGNGDNSGNAITVDSQDRILVTGSSRNSAGNTDMVIWRFKTDGSLDTTFNSKGFVVHNNAAGGAGDDSGNGIAIDSQGKIVVTGSSTNSAGDTDMVTWRFKTDGTLDGDFNGGGIVINSGAAGSNGDDSGNAVAVDSQDRILVTGTSKNSTNTDMVVWRINADGSLDITFAAYGILAHNSAAGGNGDDSGNAIAVDSQDRILVAGSSKNTAGNSDMVIWRVFP